VATIGGGDSVNCNTSKFGATHAASDFAVSWADNLRNNVPDSEVFDVSEVRVPPDTSVCGNDIALLELTTNVPADQAMPIQPRVDTAPMVDEVFDAVGYGLTNPNDMQGTTAGKRMRFDGAHVGCVGAADCQGTGAAATEWAANVPVCSGDSGGPALDAGGRVIGVTSRGPQECDFAVYSAVSPWKTFIVDGATDASDDGGYEPPGWVTGMGNTDGGMPVPDGGVPSDAGSPLSDGGLMVGDAGLPMRDGGAAGSSGMMTGDAGMPVRDGGAAGSAGRPTSNAGAAGGAGRGGGAAGGTGTGGAGKPSADAGTTTQDGGLPISRDGGAGASSAQKSGDTEGSRAASDAGCGCRLTPGSAPERSGAPLLLAAAVALALQRRRAPRGHDTPAA
jgi:MYXO-CTERM domain-containing protein